MNGDTFDIIEKISRTSRQWMIQMREAAVHNDRSGFNEALCQYIQCRYMLLTRPKLTDNLYTLAQISVERMSGLPREVTEKLESESGCTGAKSAMIKKVLLIMSLIYGLKIQIPEAEASDIETAGALAELCWQKMLCDDQTHR